MISHHDKCVFVHIPKCAGQSVEMYFLRRLGLDWDRRAPLLLRYNDVPSLGPRRLAHLKAHEYVDCKWLAPAQFDEYFKFAFVRNPWDRMASFYRYLGYDWRCSFSRFVLHHLPRLLEGERWHWFLRPQAEFILGEDGRVLVDFVGRFESLQQDFATACGHMGLSDTRLPHVNDSRKPRGPTRWLKRRPRPYREMYDSRTEKAVATLYEADVDTFKYSY